MTIAGIYDCTIATPLGAQKARLTLAVDGTRLTGHGEGDVGTVAIENGTVSGDSARWTMAVTRPMPVKLEVNAQVSGDMISGDVRAGFFGTYRLTGTRVA